MFVHLRLSEIENEFKIFHRFVRSNAFLLQSDIWAMGVCVFEMTTLRRPFDARSMHQLIFKIIHGQVMLIVVVIIQMESVILCIS